ncbi:MAG: hypothetical protein ABIF77_13295 [bacterium]
MNGFHLSESLEVWIAAVLTLMVFSFLYRDNPFYKFAEHLLVGVSAAYFMVLGFWATLWPNAVVKLIPAAARVTNPEAEVGEPDLLVLVPVALGLLLLSRLWPRWAWLSRWATAFAIGTTAGYNLTRYLRSDFLNQIASSVRPGMILFADGELLSIASANQLITLLGTVCGLAYFTYARTSAGPIGRMARIGIMFLMVTFGASFGYAVMGRVAVLIGRFRELLGDWLGLM